MKFLSFAFKNFKGIVEETLDLTARGEDARVVTLVGLNESGKTTLLEGIDRFVAGNESAEIGPKHIGDWRPAAPSELVPISERANFNDEIKIVATLSLSSEDQEYVRTTVRKATGFRIYEFPESLQIINVYAFKNSRSTTSTTRWPGILGKGRTKQGTTLYEIRAGGQRHSIWLTTIAALRSRIPTIWYFPNFLFDFPEYIHLNPSEGDESASNKLYRSLLQDILQSISPGLDVMTHIVERALSTDAADGRALRQLRLNIGREVTQSVVESWNQLFRSSEMTGKRVEVEIDTTESGEVRLSFTLEDADGIFSIRERSLGFRWFFVYLLLTTYRGRRQGTASEIVFLFDEPASNLHTSAQAVLLESLATLSRTARIIYTTHSQHLISPRWLETTYVVSNEGLDPSKVTSARASRTDIRAERYASFANRHPGRSHYFQPVLDVLDYQPSRLELVPEVVMVEGKSDYYLLRYFTDYYRQPTSESVHLLPGTGSGTLDLPIQLYTAWGRNFIILLDSDGAGEGAKQRYSDRFGLELAQRVAVLADFAPGATALESLLEESDKLAFERVVDPAVSHSTKKGFGRGVEHAFATRSTVSLSEASVERLSRVLDGASGLLRRVDPQSASMPLK